MPHISLTAEQFAAAYKGEAVTRELPFTLRLPFSLTNGNDGRGNKWYNSAKQRNDFEAQLRALGYIAKPFPFRVRLTVTRVLGKGQRLWDWSSCGRGSWKEIEDALVACGWFHDDCPKWISTDSTFRQDASRRDEGPAIEIEIQRSGSGNAKDSRS